MSSQHRQTTPETEDEIDDILSDTSSSSSSSMSSSNAAGQQRKDDHTPIKSFYLPLSTLKYVLTIPSQLFFLISGMAGFAHFPRQIVNVHSRFPALIDIKGKGKVEKGKESIKLNLNEWIGENVPSLKGVFTPTWYLPNGHLQTIYSVLGDFTKVDQVDYVRTYLRVPDGGTIGLDFAPTNHADLPSHTPTIVICHGLTGGSHESYVRNIVVWAIKPVEQGGLGARAVVVNFRGCAGVPLTSPRLYSAGTTTDLSLSLHYLRYTYPQSPLHGLGFSLGAAVLARYIGESSSSSLVSSGLVLGCPWDIPAMSYKLENHWLNTRIYSRAMAQNLLRLFFNHYDKNPKVLGGDHSPVKELIPTIVRMRKKRGLGLKDIDQVMTSQLGGPRGMGLWPFKDADEYYEFASPTNVIAGVRRPLLAINAFDDPIIDSSALPIDQIQSSSHIHLSISGGGGHLGWFTKGKQRWIRQPVSEFLTAACRDLAIKGAVVKVEVDKADRRGGWVWVKEAAHEIQGGEKVGWKVLEEGEIVHGSEGSGVLQGL